MSDLMRQFEEQFGLTVNHEGKIVTTSIKVGLVYEKDHADVMKKIRKFIELIPELNLGNFTEVTYKAGNGQLQPMYEMDRQGFSMLVNKFTGDEATIFTWKYTKAFEDMAQEIERLKEEKKIITDIALSDSSKEQRLLEMNQHDFSERRTQKSFANCIDYDQYKQLIERFVEYIKPMDVSVRISRMESAIKGMEKLTRNFLLNGTGTVGDAVNVDVDIKYLLRQIDKINNKSLGGEKGAKTKKIKELKEQLKELESQLENDTLEL